MSDHDAVQGKKRFWAINKENLVLQIWEHLKALRLNREAEIDAHVKPIRVIEVRDEEDKVQREAKMKCVK